MIAISALRIIALGQLLFTHLWLIRNGMSTYDYILEKREIEEIDMQLKENVISKLEYEFRKKQIKQQFRKRKSKENSPSKKSKVIVAVSSNQSLQNIGSKEIDNKANPFSSNNVVALQKSAEL